MVQVSDALQTILAEAHPLGHETVQLTRAGGRILAQDVMADADLPGLPRSSVDGYAIRAGDSAAEFEVLEEVTAGRLAHGQVRSGTAVRIMTGGTVPTGVISGTYSNDLSLTGALTLKTALHIPPGPVPVHQRLTLKGVFNLDQAAGCTLQVAGL